MAYLTTFTVLVLIVSAVAFVFLKQLLVDEIHASRLDVLKQIGERANAVNNSIITISNLYTIAPNLLGALSGEPENAGQIKKQLDEMKTGYNTVFRDVGISYEIVVIGENGFQYSSQAGDAYDFTSLKNQLWYKTIYEKKGDITFISSFRDVFGSDTGKYVFSASRTIKDSGGNPLGTLMINIDEAYLERLYHSSLNGNNSIYIIDSKGNVISHSYKNMRGMHFIDIDNFNRLYKHKNNHVVKKSQGDYLLSYYYDPYTGWTIIEEVPVAVVFSAVDEALYIMLGVVAVCLVIALFVSMYISGRISRPLLTLCNAMGQIQHGDFDVSSNVSGYAEIEQLNDSFNEMAHEIKQLMEDIQTKEAYKRQAELDFLRAQINPHFLYNTLFSIKCQAEIDKNQQVSAMLGSFIDLLKMTLRKGSNLIPLKEEAAVTEKYLALQQICYRYNFSFEFELDEDTLDCAVPALILQPIVENALFHGIKAKGDFGMIILSSGIIDKQLMICISDDGAGMASAAIEEIEEKFNAGEKKSNDSIGIANVSKRLKKNFGNEYGVRIQSSPGIGTNVVLNLPVLTARASGGMEETLNEDFNR